jgi:hypothetical protein
MTENHLLSDTGKIDLRGQVYIEIYCNRQPVPASDFPSLSPAALVGAIDRARSDAGPDRYRLVFVTLYPAPVKALDLSVHVKTALQSPPANYRLRFQYHLFEIVTDSCIKHEI